MKKIQSICIVALLAAFALTSCNYTDLDPTDMVGPDKAFGNVQNVHKAVVGIYGKASLRSKLAVTEYIADDCVQGGDSGGAGTDLAGWVYTATSGDVSGLWAHYYGIINQANRVLNYGPKVKPLNAEEETSLQVSLARLTSSAPMRISNCSASSPIFRTTMRWASRTSAITTWWAIPRATRSAHATSRL